MTEIVTLAEVKLYCRVDHLIEDDLFNILIAAATEAVLDSADGWDGEGEVPARLKLAVMTHVVRAYGEREDGADMPASCARLIAPLRALDV